MSDIFERSFRERLGGLSAAENRVLLEKAADLDHPVFQELELGESAEGAAAVLFLDIRGYTRLSMALKRPEVARILHAVLGASIEALHFGYGAHINDFTGDGVMAVFGDVDENLDFAHGQAIYGATHLMGAMSATLREELLKSGIDDPVQIAIGLVSGRVLWARLGTEAVNRVMVVGEVAPLAAKYVSGSETNAWDIMIGGEIAQAVPDEFKEPQPDYVHSYKGEREARKRWLLDWQNLGNEVPNQEAAVAMMAGAPEFSSMVGRPSPAPRHPRGTRREKTVG